MKLRTKAKFYIKSKAVYVDLFNRGMQIYFCYQGAEYIHVEYKIFRSVSAKGEKIKEIKVVDWHRLPFFCFEGEGSE
tara:strand:+ start:247 stop:477 length:231 start_codon:yes stop_codon:yes gene_type:complete